jgi:hypothetical protein
MPSALVAFRSSMVKMWTGSSFWSARLANFPVTSVISTVDRKLSYSDFCPPVLWFYRPPFVSVYGEFYGAVQVSARKETLRKCFRMELGGMLEGALHDGVGN